MRYLSIFLFCFLFFSCSQSLQKEHVFEDFETGNFKKWKVQGIAFDKPILADTIQNFIFKESIKGKYCAYSHVNDGVLNQGKLISPQFKITHKYIDFLIGGGKNSTRTCINLLINNKIVRTQTGSGNKVLSKATWDVQELIGQNAIIEIVDALHSNPIGLDFLIVDHIVFSDHTPRPTLIFDNFESGKFEHWQVEGEAFESPRNRKNIYYPVTVSGFEGKYFAFSFGETHDKKKGRLTSVPFVIERNYIQFLIGGGNHTDTTCVNLLINDSVYFSSTGLNTGELRNEFWDVSKHIGTTAQIEIKDDYSDWWGHIIADDFRFTDEPHTENVIIENYFDDNENRSWIVGFICLALLITLMLLVKQKSRKRKQTDLSKPKEKDFQKILKKLLEEDRIYLNPELSPKEVAKNFQLSTNDFLDITERKFKVSFYDLVNEQRVECFKKEVLREENKDFTLVAVSEKCGFNSKSSFYRIFKKHTNITPTEFMQSIKK